MNLINNVCALLYIGIISYCCFANGVSLFSFHPLFMSIGFIIFMTTAINAVTPGDFATEWMPIRLRSARHWVLQLIAITFTLAGFIIIVANKIINDKLHFVSLHGKFGLASVIFTCITSVGGIGALFSLKLKNILAPTYTKLIHAFIGLTTLCLGIFTIILGQFSPWWSFGEGSRYSGLFLVLIIMVLTNLRPSLKVYFRLKDRLGYNNN
ncbi:unnamed protein product [Leptidea sinapis]|nr:unnamed protein product [Leptidea sinapis]